MQEQKEEIYEKNFVRWFSELSLKDADIAGIKGSFLAEMYKNNFPVPQGFVITSDAFSYFLKKNGIDESIKEILKSIDIKDSDFEEKCSKIRKLIEESNFPEDLEKEILEAYELLGIDPAFENASGTALDILKAGKEPSFVAVRNSIVITNEKANDFSFAGQQKSFIGVKGKKEIINSVKKVFASLFTQRAVYYRKKRNIECDRIAVVIQKMIDSEKSGTVFSKNPLNEDGSIIIESVFGLGIGLVSGKISPDQYKLSPEYELLGKKTSNKRIALVRNSQGEIESVALGESTKKETLSGHEIKILSQYALRLEGLFGVPQDMEFAIERDKTYILQSRPLTIPLQLARKEVKGKEILSGISASLGIAEGKVVTSIKKEGDSGGILVSKTADSDASLLKNISGLILDEGGITSHISIIARELAIPLIIGIENATKRLKDGQEIIVDGFSGKVLEKGQETEEKNIEIEKDKGDYRKSKDVEENDVDNEKLILKALDESEAEETKKEDKEKKEVFTINDLRSLFEGVKEEKLGDKEEKDSEEEKQEEIKEKEYEKKLIFETQSDDELEKNIIREAEEFEAYSEEQAKKQRKEEQGGDDDVLDIF